MPDAQPDQPASGEARPDGPASAEVTPDEVALHDLVPAEQAPPSDPAVDVTGPATPAVPLPVAPEVTGYTPGGVPTFDYVREKIETRSGTAMGAAELAAETPEGRSVEEQYEARQKAAADRLAQIRESMRGDAPDNS